MPDSDVVLYEKLRAVGHLVLNRPKVINAFNIQMRDELYMSLSAANDDPEVRAILISGAGDRGFCAGADLSEFGTAPSQVVARRVRWERDLWGLFMSIRKPLVAAVHGFVFGSGVEITCLCDIRIASDDAVFRMPEAALSLVPAAGGTQTLSRNKIEGTYPEDMMNLMRQALRMIDHLNNNSKDKHNRRQLELTESRIRRIARYYKSNGRLDRDWTYKRDQLRLMVE